jgi:hypothetical protein
MIKWLPPLGMLSKWTAIFPRRICAACGGYRMLQENERQLVKLSETLRDMCLRES